MTDQQTATTALQRRLVTLDKEVAQAMTEQQRHQDLVDTYQRRIDKAQAETESIQQAMAVLEAAAEYTEETS